MSVHVTLNMRESNEILLTAKHIILKLLEIVRGRFYAIYSLGHLTFLERKNVIMLKSFAKDII